MYTTTETMRYKKDTEIHQGNNSLLEDTLYQLNKTRVSKNNSLRIKVTNSCPFTCNFCHHEGNFNNGHLIIDKNLIHGLTRIYREMGLTEAHLTGGEPTSYPPCLDLIRELKSIGFTVKMTSNGQFDTLFIEQLKEAGLHGINFSIHTLDPSRLCSMQNRNRDRDWGLRSIQRQLSNLETARTSGLEVKVNTVVQHSSDISDVLKILDFCKKAGVSFRMLNDLDQGSSSIQRIGETLRLMDATVESINLTDKSSGCSLGLISEDGYKFKVKAIRENRLKTLCGDCNHRAACKEWFYGIRVEQSGSMASVRLCLQRQDYPALQTFEEFFTSKQFRELL